MGITRQQVLQTFLGAVVFFLSLYSLQQRENVKMTEGYTNDPDTNVKVSNALKVDGKWLNLLGVGVRTKVVVNVYTAALYADPNALVKDLKAFEGQDKQQILGSAAVGKAVAASGAQKAVLLSFVRAVGAEKVAEALSDVPGAGAKAKKDLGACVTGNGPLAAGDQLMLAWKGKDTLSVRTKHAVLCTLKDAPLAKGVLELYVGAKPVSPKLKASVAAGLEELLRVKPRAGRGKQGKGEL